MNDLQSPVSGAPRWYEPSIYKLYVCPVNDFTKETLKEFFTQYAEVVDIFMSHPNESGFKWAFLYFSSEEGLLEAVSCIEKDNVHNLKLSRARPRSFLPNGSKSLTPSAKIMNGDVSADGKSFVPNCASCKKLTFHQCGSCKNPFCSKECTLDGWRFHTGPCVKVADLIRADETNGQDYAITPKVVNFMKDMKHTKKNFTTKEFADACVSGKGVVCASSSFSEQIESAWDDENANKKSEVDKRQYHRKPLSVSFQKQMMITDQDESDLPVARAASRKFQKRDNDTSRQPFKTKFNNRAPKTDAEDNHNVRSKVTNQKPSRRCLTDVEDGEENESHRRKSFPKGPPQHRNSSIEEPNRYRNDVDKRASDRKNSFKGAGRSEDNKPKVTKIVPQTHQTDLKLKEGAALDVVVTSIADRNTFFIANREKVVRMLTRIIECAAAAPALDRVDLNTICLACFDGDYYRARVVHTDPIEVEYIDYGNRETCTINTLKVLPESLSVTLPLAAKVQLKSGDVHDQNHQLEENKEVTIYVNEYRAADNCYIVDVL